MMGKKMWKNMWAPFLAGMFISLQLSAQFSHQVPGNVFPWTKVPVINSEDFRFVIIGDLTGGEEEGVFESAIEKINQMAPDFVMCVGDLIEGYTLDQATIDKQWKGLQDRLDKLNAPFFYLPGNHDFSNTKLAQAWLSRLGRDYYSFSVNHALFLMINMYDPDQDGISDAQVQYIKAALEAHDKKYPVYVFSHAPLWKMWNKQGYDSIDNLINSYNTTFFCGHEHHYLLKEDRGHEHYMLAKTGGGFDESRINLGDFDHFLWVTFNSNGHTVANILLDGVISPGIVDNSTETQVNILRRGSWFKLMPSVTENNNVDIVQSQLFLVNQGDYPLSVEGALPVNEQFIVNPQMISRVIPVGGKVSIPLELRRLVSAPVDSWPEVVIELSASFQQPSKDLHARTSKRWIIDSQKRCTPVSGRQDTIFCTKPEVVEESWCWNGIEDGRFDFTSTYDEKYIYIHIETKDDTLIKDVLDPQSIQDRLTIHFSADTSFVSPNIYAFELIAGGDLVIQAPKVQSSTGISGKCVSNGNALEANIQIPKSYLTYDAFRVNIGFIDHDDPTSNEPSTIWWKPEWRSWNDYSGSGVFILQE